MTFLVFSPSFRSSKGRGRDERTNERTAAYRFRFDSIFFHGYFSFTSNTPQVDSPASPWPISFLTFRKPFQVKTQPIKLSSLLFPLFSPFSLFSFFFEIPFSLFHLLYTSKVVFSLRSTFLDLTMLYVLEKSYVDPWNLLLRATSLRVLSFLLFANYLFYIYIYIFFSFFLFSFLPSSKCITFVIRSLFVPLESKKEFIEEIC